MRVHDEHDLRTWAALATVGGAASLNGREQLGRWLWRTRAGHCAESKIGYGSLVLYQSQR